MTNQIDQIEIFRSLKLSHNFFHGGTVFKNVAQKSLGMRPQSHTQKVVDKSLSFDLSYLTYGRIPLRNLAISCIIVYNIIYSPKRFTKHD